MKPLIRYSPISVSCVGPIIALLFLLSCSELWGGGGAWRRGPGGYYFKVGFTSTTAEKEKGFGGEDRPLFRDTLRYANAVIGLSNITLYSEYGLTSWLTSIISTQYTVVVREADIVEKGMEGAMENESASGLSDIWVGGRFPILPGNGPFVGSGSLLLKIPTGSPNKDVPLGTGVVDYEGNVAFGLPFVVGGSHNAYAQVSGGYRLRNMAADELIWQVEGGINLIPTLKGQLLFDGTHSTVNFDSASAESLQNPLLYDELVGSQSFSRMSLGLIYDLSDYMELNLLYSTILDGRNTLDATSISIGVAWKFDPRSDTAAK